LEAFSFPAPALYDEVKAGRHWIIQESAGLETKTLPKHELNA